MMKISIQLIFAAFIIIWAVITDVRYHKIKNYTVVIGIAGGLIINFWRIGSAAAGMLLPLVLLVFFYISWIGAGDIKLFCAVGAIFCFPEIINIMLYTFVFCGIQIFLHKSFRNQAGKNMKDIFQSVYSLLFFRVRAGRDNNAHKTPMAVSLAFAVIIVELARLFSIKWIYLF